MKRLLYFGYGIFSYLMFLAVYIYFIFWENNTFVAKGIDFGDSWDMISSIVLDMVLITLVFVPHSLRTRNTFKKMKTLFIPEAIERSTCVLVSSILLGFLILFWQPVPIILYDVRGSWLGTTLLALSFSGFAMTLICTFLFSHFDLFGLRQVFYNLVNKELLPHAFATPLLYKLVRHPLYFSFLIAFWCNPVLTVGHLLLTVLATLYTFLGVFYEEKNLNETFGATYEVYSKKTPKLFPSLLNADTLVLTIGLTLVCMAIGYIMGPIGL